MANIIKVTLTDDMLKLIRCITFQEFHKIRENDRRQEVELAIDMNNIYGGSFLYEDISYILGIYDKHIEGTEEDYDGPKFPVELEDYMYDMHAYIMENILYIEQIVHQIGVVNGLKAGTYVSKRNEEIWSYINEEEMK